MTFFAKTLIPEITSRIWDIFFLEGFIAILKGAISKKLITFNLI